MHAVTKEKPRGWVGAHGGGRSSPRSGEGSLRRRVRGSVRRRGERKPEAGRTAPAGLGAKQLQWCPLTEHTGEQAPPVAVSLDLFGSPFLAQRCPLVTPLAATPDSCPELLTQRSVVRQPRRWPRESEPGGYWGFMLILPVVPPGREG